MTGMVKPIGQKYLWLISCLLLLSACGAPIFHSDAELFAPAPEVIDAVRPYLDQWITLPPDQTKAQRDEIGSRLKVAILITNWPNTSTGKPVTVVDIILYQWASFRRGYLYVHDDVELKAQYKWELRPAENHLYLYNTNE